MPRNELPVVVIGATGFVGGRVVAALRERRHLVRCLVRDADKGQTLAGDGVEVLHGDMLDFRAVEDALTGSSTVVVCVHTLSRQIAAQSDQGFMDIEAAGMSNVIAACRVTGVKRVVYVTSIGVAEHATSSWLRGRWQTEQALLSSGLDATIVRPGIIVGQGGDGFGIVTRAATKAYAIAVAGPRQKFRTVAVDDLANDIVDLIDLPQAFGSALDVGSDDVLTMREMATITADTLGRRRGMIVFIPGRVIRFLAPAIERIARVPAGAISGFVGEGARGDMVGDPTELREILGRSDRPFRDAIVGMEA
ncbi:NAD(P)H-binding protein [Subtercola sp. PAMC28395]|uniref:SDR family oxidoreductase n=1 Tax=Subtercola sp. PAMC28395 TaxID=2846775 RepID=UPI001C0E56E9|nr:NAD(P)H-binding protein [Subtercola sp. PAMC28395]QWT24080.1 NAD(P)H-binding protein [Subtercola sp. PAMC28395]